MSVTLRDFLPAEPVGGASPRQVRPRLGDGARLEGRTGPFARVRAVAFDLDCTLIDILHVKARAAEAAAWALADAGLEIDPRVEARSILDTGFEIGIDRHDVVNVYLERLLGAPDERFVEIARHAFERAEDANAVPYPRTQRTLVELSRRGFHLSLVTDAPRKRAVGRLQSARLLPFFDPLITLEDTENGKADPAPFRLLLDRLGLEPPELLVVGDNPARDVGSAKRLGCPTVLAAYGLQDHFASDAPEHQADARVDLPDEILDLLAGGPAS